MTKQLLIYLSIFLVFSCSKDDSCGIDGARCHIYTIPSCVEIYESYDPVISELNKNIYPISGSSPSLAKEELRALDDVIGEVQFLGLGEATHGTLEFFEMKDRIFRYLVEEHGFKAMGFEATWGGSLFVNEYVLHGKGNAREAIGKMQFWTWNTEEVLALVEWMRAYNDGKDDADKIYFYGFDVQSGSEELYWLETFLEPIHTDLRNEITQLIKPFIDAANFTTYKELSSSEQLGYQDDIRNARSLYIKHEDAIVAASDRRQYELYAYAFEVLLMFEDVIDGRDGRSRDSYMATNSQWISEYLGDNSKVALWAHNGHVSKKYLYKSQGEFLQELEGENYKNIGFSFAKGTFQAVNGQTRRLTTSNEIEEVECKSAVGVFDAVNEENFYVLKDDLLSNDVLSAYFNSTKKYLNIGSLYNGNAQAYLYDQNLTKSFDVFIHFTNTNAAKPL